MQDFIRISFKWRSHLEKRKCRGEDINKIHLKETGLAVPSYRSLVFVACCFGRGDETSDAIRA
jgi:hypothetical protein